MFESSVSRIGKKEGYNNADDSRESSDTFMSNTN